MRRVELPPMVVVDDEPDLVLDRSVVEIAGPSTTPTSPSRQERVLKRFIGALPVTPKRQRPQTEIYIFLGELAPCTFVSHHHLLTFFPHTVSNTQINRLFYQYIVQLGI